jgi:hypothetical protein
MKKDLESLFRADPGPSSSELAEARLLLKRALARDRSGAATQDPPTSSPAPLRLLPRRIGGIVSQACGFALLIALLVPVLPKLLPEQRLSARGPDLVASLADGARSVGARIESFLPSLPPLPLPTSLQMGMETPATQLFDWIPSLHSPAR